MAGLLLALLCSSRSTSSFDEDTLPARPKMSPLPSDSAVALPMERGNSKPFESTTTPISAILTNGSSDISSLSLCKQYSKSRMTNSNDETTIEEQMAKVPKYYFGFDGTMAGGDGLVRFFTHHTHSQSLLTMILETFH